MPADWILITLAVVAATHMAFAIGANDMANAMATSVGSRALTLRRAILLAMAFEVAGALLLGAPVGETVRNDLFDPALAPPRDLALGVIAALLAAGGWLQLATFLGWPVSTTHAIVGGMLGVGLVLVGAEALHWDRIAPVAGGWVLSPLLAAATTYLLFRLLRRRVFVQPDPVAAAKRAAPWLTFCVVAVLVGATAAQTAPARLDAFAGRETRLLAAGILILLAVVGGLIAALVARRMVAHLQPEPLSTDYLKSVYLTRSLNKARKHLRRVRELADAEGRARADALLKGVQQLGASTRRKTHPQLTAEAFRPVQRVFVYLQVLSACCFAFAHGANDAGNAAGPLAAAVGAVSSGAAAHDTPIPLWALALAGVGIAAGVATWGWRVTETVGQRITPLAPAQGFAAQFGAALTILVASMLGMPVSTTHTLVGAVVGVGLASGADEINTGTIGDIVLAWLATLPATAAAAVLLFYALRVPLG